MIPLLQKSKYLTAYKNAVGQTVNVYTTEAYDEFVLVKANRAVVEKTVRKIMDSMLIRVEHAPILVNEKGELMDGQHRLEAYRRLKYPITFEMIDGLKVENIRRLNAIQKEWKIMDHLHAGAVEDELSYKWLHNFCTVHNIQPTTAIVLLKGSAAYSVVVSEAIRSGKFTCSKEERASAAERMAILEKFRGYSKATSKNFAHALVRVLEHPQINVKKLVSSFLTRYKQVLAGIAGSYEQYMFQLQEMYNYRQPKEKHLKFLSVAELERLNRKG
jgi:hypothetical protein